MDQVVLEPSVDVLPDRVLAGDEAEPFEAPTEKIGDSCTAFFVVKRGVLPNRLPLIVASRAATMSSPRGSPSAKPGCPAPHAGPIQTPISASLSTQKTEYEKIASDSRAQTGEIQFTRITRRTTRGVPVEPGAPYHRSCRSLPPSRRQA